VAEFDRNNPPAWVHRLAERWGSVEGRHVWAEEGQRDGPNAISLGFGTFIVPLPRGWSMHPERPCEGRLRAREGYEIRYRIDCYEDAEAAQGRARLLAYADEPELRGMAATPADVVDDFLISIPEGDAAGKDVIVKCLEPFAGTHVRDLVLRCRLETAEQVEHRMDIGQTLAEWLGLGGFSPEPTALDRVAHTATLERVNFQDTVLMRVPRAYKVEVVSEEDGRKSYAAEDPEDRDSIWISSDLLSLSENDDPDAALSRIVAALWENPQVRARKWLSRRREKLGDDVLMITANEEEGSGETLRRITWMRFGVRDDVLICASIHLVTAARYLAEPAQIEMEALVDREVRNAILSPPPPKWE
jgi:hypothetical protein